MSFEDVVSGRRPLPGDVSIAPPAGIPGGPLPEENADLEPLELLNERFDSLVLALTAQMRKMESSCARLLKLCQHVGNLRSEDVSEITTHLAAEKRRASASSTEIHEMLSELSGVVARMAEWGDFESVHYKMRELYLQYGRVAEMFSRACKMVNTIMMECKGSPAFVERSVVTGSAAPAGEDARTLEGGVGAPDTLRQRHGSTLRQEQRQEQVPVVVVDRRREREMEQLVTELTELHGLFAELAGHVQREAAQVNTIEGNIAEARDMVAAGKVDLKKASRYQVGAYPLVGAVLGGLVAGPVGVLAGLKGAAVIGACMAGLGIGAGAGAGIRTIALKNVDSVEDEADAIAHQRAVDDMAQVLKD